MAGEIFISYRRADQAKARLLHALLKQRGVDAWYDGLLGPGEDWRRKTAQALEQAQIFVLLFSKVASESDDISKELAAATFSKKLVIPVRIENIQPTGAFLYELASRNWIDAYEDTEVRFADLADKLAALVNGGAGAEVAAFSLGAPEPAPAMQRSKAPWFKQSIVLASAAVLAVALLAGAFFMMRGPAPAAAAGAAAGDLRVAFFGYTSDDDPAAKQAAAIATEEGYNGLSTARLDAVNRVDIEHGGDGSTIDRAAALGARFMLEGSVRGEGDKLRVTATLVDVASRATIFQNSLAPKNGDPRYAGASSAIAAVTFTNCVAAYVSGSGVPAPDPATLKLFGDICTRQSSLQDAPLRDLLKRHPDSGLAQGRLASALTYTMLNVPAAQRPARLAEAEAALAHAETLAPDAFSTAEARISVGIAHDRPPLDWLPRAETDLARSPSRQEAFFYSSAKSTAAMTLLQLGRTTDAALYLQAAYDNDPNARVIRYHLQFMRAAAGQYGAREGLEDVLSKSVIGYFWEVAIVSAIFMDVLDPETVIKRAPEDILTFVPCYRDLAVSLKAKDAKTRLAGAKRADACLTTFDSPHVNIMAQAMLGDMDRAFAIADRPDLTQMFWNYFPTLFLPPNSAMRADPRFLPLMQKLGYVDYWKQTKTQPDVCATPAERDIPLCVALREAG